MLSHQSLWLQIPELLGIPLLVFVILAVIKDATGEKRFGPGDAAELGMELSILAAGACGGIFGNETLISRWGFALITYGITVSLTCIVFVAVLARARRWQAGKPVSIGKAVLHLFLGAIPLGLVTSVLILGYTFTPRS